jgi:SAM-dependent methyltransferase
MFSRSLKKQQKLTALLDILGPVEQQRCLLLTCGDNNGALNWYFREHGGCWVWGDLTGETVEEMSQFLGEPVQHTAETALPFADNHFERIISIDCLEHLNDDQPFLQELKRVVHPTGQVIVTVPNGDPKLLANRIKWWVGMTPEMYGHTRAGYTIAELRESLEKCGFRTAKSGGYSRFFTEMMELVINFAYVFVLSRKKSKAEAGQIAPTSSGDMKTHGAAYKIYSLLYPVMNVVSKLDALLPASTNNAVIVSGGKAREQ